jgi:hypothetical protein
MIEYDVFRKWKGKGKEGYCCVIAKDSFINGKLLKVKSV